MQPSLTLGHLLRDCLLVWRAFEHILIVFLGRNWLAGLSNAVVTALAGLGLLRLASFFWPLRSSPLLRLRLRRLVCLVALCKGAFSLIIGANLNTHSKLLVAYGFQVAPSSHLDFFDWSRFSIWNHTSATLTITLVMGGIALILLVFRAWRVAASGRALAALDQIFGETDSRAEEALKRAAAVIRIKPNAILPKILLVEVECATPLLLGVRQPRLLISPRLVAMLSDDELEMALRHELAHFKRRDHWWRWIQLWIEDIGRPIFVAGRLGAWSVETEEFLCDRLAVYSPQDAAALARAITKAADLLKKPHPPAPQIPLQETVVPSLLGRHGLALNETNSLEHRVRALLALSQELTHKQSDQYKANEKRLSVLALRVAGFPLFLFAALLLLIVLYARYYLFLNIR